MRQRRKQGRKEPCLPCPDLPWPGLPVAPCLPFCFGVLNFKCGVGTEIRGTELHAVHTVREERRCWVGHYVGQRFGTLIRSKTVREARGSRCGAVLLVKVGGKGSMCAGLREIAWA